MGYLGFELGSKEHIRWYASWLGKRGGRPRKDGTKRDMANDTRPKYISYNNIYG